MEVEGLLKPSTGEYYWDESSQSLKFNSNNPTDTKDKKKRAKGAVFNIDRRNERTTPSVSGKPHVVGKSRNTAMKSPKLGHKPLEHTNITLEDIKSVALDILSEKIQLQMVNERGDDSVSPLFISVYGTEQFDDFLLHLFYYFHCYIEKKVLDEKPNPMNIEPSLREIQEKEIISKKLEQAQKLLGQSYCVLIMGLGLTDFHHMSCGLSRVSATDPDRILYENLYEFCTLATWITFKRKHYEVIKKEVGRMLRSDTFNPALRVKYLPEPESDDDPVKPEGEEKKDAPKLSLAEIRKINQKRPAIKSIINQRSPAIVSILPSSREQAEWLFRRRRPLSPNSLSTFGRETDDDVDDIADFAHIVHSVSLGILGQALTNFDPVTLTPQGGDNEEDHADEENESGQMEEKVQDATSPLDGIQSRVATAMSSATTEAMSDDDE